ncbi:hypothetical protein GE061_004181 [Apolygus lucorum]|uniref:NACHT domain-containing protein n=1 Tax=Apolygus lucorum TaxID=248454 RepID=A0A8S9X133_APOLU|nr:hypothetical protein GE061_004181 [Apolygus lucorum]
MLMPDEGQSHMRNTSPVRPFLIGSPSIRLWEGSWPRNDLTSIASSDALGWFNDKEKELLIGAKDVFSNKHKFLGVFAHELAHWCLELVFKNNGNPYYQSDPKRLKAREFENIVKAVHTDVQSNPNAFHPIIQACFYSGYPRSEWSRELIVRVPHLIAECGTTRTETILSRYESTKSLLSFYRSHVMDEADKFIGEGDLEGSRETIYRLNSKFDLLQSYIERDLQFCNNEDIEIHESDSILVYSSRHPFMTFFKIAHTLNCIEPNNKFYANNLFCTFQVFVENQGKIRRQFFKKEWCRTIFVLCFGVESGHLGNYGDWLEDLLELASNFNKRVILIIECKLVTPTKTQLMKTHNGRLIDLSTRKMDIRDLVETSQQRILQCPINFLGKQVQLQEIVGSDELELVDGNLIDRLLIGGNIIVGSEANIVDVRLPGFVTFYENMSVERLVEFVGECLARKDFVVIVGKSENYPEVVTRELCKLFEVDSIEELFVFPADKFRSIGETSSLPRGRVLLVPSRNEYDYVHIVDLLKNFESSVCYFIHVESSETIYSDLMYTPLLKFNRTLMLKSHQVDNDELDENGFIKQLLSGDHRLFVISDDPGSGKSIFLNDIQFVLNHSPDFDGYVMKFALRECYSFIDKHTISPDLKIEEALRFLCAFGKIDDDIARKLFVSKIKNTSKSQVVLLLDGFDEIGSSDLHDASQNKEKIANLIACLKKYTSLYIVVSTRNESETYLRNIYCTVSKFKILEEEFIASYVLRFCLSRMRLQCHMETSIQTLDNVRRYLNTAKTMPTPLHITMISELFLEMGRNESPEFYKPDFSRFDYPIIRFTMPSIEKLYEEFINLKYKLYFREKKNSAVDIRTKEHCDSVFQRLALFSIYGNEEFTEEFLSNDSMFKNGTDGNIVLNTDKVGEYYDIGIISFFSKSSIEFIHRVFAEYYISHWILLGQVTGVELYWTTNL